MKKKSILLLCIVNAISALLLVSLAFLTKNLIDYVTLNQQQVLETVFFYAGLLLGTVVLEIGCKVFFAWLRYRVQLQMEASYKTQLYTEAWKKQYAVLSSYHSGQLSHLVNNDVRNIIECATITLPNLVGNSARFVAAFFSLLLLDWTFLLLLLVIGCFAFLFSRFYGKRMKRMSREILKSDGDVLSFLQESVENAKLVKALGEEKTMEGQFQARLTENQRKKAKRNRFGLIGFAGLIGVMNLSYMLCLVYGAYAIAFLGLTFGTLTALLQLVNHLEGPLSNLSSYLTSYATYKASIERVEQFIALDKETEIEEEITTFDAIVFEQVSFYYDIEKPLIEGFNLRLLPHELALLQGESGKGKTTLFLLLLGFYPPVSGKIYLEIGDKKIPVSRATRALFAYVPQDNILFSGTIEDNFRYLAPNSTEEERMDACKKACIYEDIMAKPKRFQTQLQERGTGLSMGQIQRIVIAIALLKNKPILLLDEFTSSLDRQTEANVVASLLKEQKTILLITHRSLPLTAHHEVRL